MRSLPVRLGALAALVALTGLLAAGCGSSSDSSGDSGEGPIEIGAIFALTGPVAAYGLPQANGMKVAAEKINEEGGIEGREIKLNILDYGSQASRAATQARSLAQSEAVAVVGPTDSSARLAVEPILQAAKVPVLQVTSSPPDEAAVEYNAKTIAGTVQQVEGILDFASKNIGAKKVALVTEESEYGEGEQGAINELADEFGLEIVSDVVVPVTATDATPELSQVSDEAEALLVVAINPLTVTILKGLDQLGNETPVVGGIGFGTVEALKPAGSAADGVSAVAFLNPQEPKANQKELVTAYEGKYGEEPTYNAIYGWDPVHLIEQAVAEGGGASREQVWEGLQKIDGYEGAAGEYSWDPKTHEMFASPVPFLTYEGGSFHEPTK